MSESDFQRAICERLVLRGRRVLRSSDAKDARHGVYGLRAITSPRIDSTGADLLVLPAYGVHAVVCRSASDVDAALLINTGPLFIELKAPGARKRHDQTEQDKWLDFVRGIQR